MKRKIVIIDDCTFMQKLAFDIISDAGFTAITATNSVEANAHIFAMPPPTMIIIDVEMPLLSGDKTAKKLKGMELTKGIPVLLLSSKTDDQMQKLCADSGADGYIIKPLNSDKFEKAVSEFCP